MSATEGYTLHIANKNYSSWSLRPWVLLEALHIPYQEVLHPFGADNNQQRFRQFSPTAKVPCLHDGEAVIWDSLAIVEYVAEHHPHVWPADRRARAWARCASAEMHSGFQALRNRCSMSVGVRVRLADVPVDVQQDLARIAELWQEGLRHFGGPWLAGDRFTAVDAFFAPVVFRIQTYGLQLPVQAQDYALFSLSHPAMQRWQREALAETARDPLHEQDHQQAGVVTADLRTPTA